MLKTFIFLALLPAFAQAAAIFAPGDPTFGVKSDGTELAIATAGFGAGQNQFPGGESPDHIIDGVGQKYLNFGRLDTGAIISPTFNGGLGSIVTSLQLWAANDAVERDPASFALYGTNAGIDGSAVPLSSFTLITSGDVNLPASRNAGGASPLDDNNSETITFSNTAGYKNYLLLFPTVKGPGGNSMQISEAQLFGNAVPEPASAFLAGLSVLGLTFRRRR